MATPNIRLAHGTYINRNACGALLCEPLSTAVFRPMPWRSPACALLRPGTVLEHADSRLVFWCAVPLALHSSLATTVADTIQLQADLGSPHFKAVPFCMKSSTTLPGSLGPYDWALIGRPGQDNLYVIH